MPGHQREHRQSRQFGSRQSTRGLGDGEVRDQVVPGTPLPLGDHLGDEFLEFDVARHGARRDLDQRRTDVACEAAHVVGPAVERLGAWQWDAEDLADHSRRERKRKAPGQIRLRSSHTASSSASVNSRMRGSMACARAGVNVVRNRARSRVCLGGSV